MKILVLSDVHDYILNLEKVIDAVKGRVEAVVCCGDYCAPFSAERLLKFNLATYAVFGNNDGDAVRMIKKLPNFNWFLPSDEFGSVKIGERLIAFCHYPKLAELLAKSGDYDAVFYGHTHVARNEFIGKTLLLNPGSVCGIIGGKTAAASYAIYDSQQNRAEIINIY